MKKLISVLLVAVMLLSLFAGCSKKEASSPETTTPSTDNSSASNETVADADATYTYHGTYSGVSTWSPTDWTISSEYDMLGYTVSTFYGFWMNETKDGYDIVCELAEELPVDVTANYAGNATYGVPADATEGYAWQIKMREDAVWEDGTPITAHDVEYTLQQFLNPEMKNYRASLFYTGGTALANAEAYYNSSTDGEAVPTPAASAGLTMADLSVGEDGQYVDAEGNPAYFAWTIKLDYLGGYSLQEYGGAMELDTYYALYDMDNGAGYIPVTDEAIDLLLSFTSSDYWGNETRDDLINYIYCNAPTTAKALLNASEQGLSMADLAAGEDGQYVDAEGNPAYFAWTIKLDYLGGYSLQEYGGAMELDTYYALYDMDNGAGYIPVTDEAIDLLLSFTSSDYWGNETRDDLINYVYCEATVDTTITWEQVGYVEDDPYTFTIVLKNPTSLLEYEMNIDNLLLVHEGLYEANKTETGGIIKSAYGTGVDKFCSYGPYKIVKYQEGKQIVFEKNESWFGYSDSRYEGQYQTTGIDLLQIDEHTTQLSMFLQGNLDSVGLSQDDMTKYGTSDYVYYTPQTYSYYLALNTDFDMLKSRETPGINKTIVTYIDFRKAMSFSFDRTDYVKSCTACSEPAYGLLNNMYICDLESGETYRSSVYAQDALRAVYGVDDLDGLTGYNKDEATRLLQSAYDACYADGNISDTDVVEIEYHVYGTDSTYQKMVDYIQDAMLAAAEGTSLEDRIRFVLVEDQDYYTTMTNGQDDMINGAWGGSDLDPYAMMICWVDPTYVMEYGFDVYQDLTINVQGEDITMSFNQWYNELYNGAYAIAERDVRTQILAGMEKGLLLNYHMIPIFASSGASLASHRLVYGSEEYINSIVERGGIQFLTYTMNDAEWAAYCAEQNNILSY